MARDTGKALDNALDWANNINGRIKMALVRIEMYREAGLTANEIEILNTLSALLQEESA